MLEYKPSWQCQAKSDALFLKVSLWFRKVRQA